MISASIIAVIDVVSAGLRTTVLPAANAGAIFHAAINRGKFQGMIWPATPTGETLRLGKAYSSLSAHPAQLKKWAAESGRSTSRDTLIGLGPFIVSATARPRDFS